MEPAVRHPVGEEEDVARLLLHHAVEALHQRAGEDARVRRQAEEPEGEEGVEALPIPHAQEAPLRVARAHPLAGGDGNALGPEHAFQERGVTALLAILHGDRLAQQAITLELRHGVPAPAGAAPPSPPGGGRGPPPPPRPGWPRWTPRPRGGSPARSRPRARRPP